MAGWKDKLCCHFSCLRRRRESRPKSITTPLPWTKLLIVCAVLYVNQFGIFLVFPFLPFMIHDFFPYLDKTELGNKAGYLGSAYFVGNFIGSLLWGWISDKIGRRPVLLMGMLGTLATELLFGFSQNFAWAIAARFLWGLLNGNLGVAKTYISEICDDTNQASGFAAVGTTAGLGRLSGSVIGGYLAQPASKFGPLKKPFFCKYPYSLPCIVGAALAVISFIAGFFLLEESLHTKKGNLERRGSHSSHEDDSTSSSDRSSTKLETNDSSGSLLSNDSGIELKLNGSDSDTELIDVTQPEMADHDDELMMMESDIDTDSDFERVNSDTELLISERRESRNSDTHSTCSRFVKRFIPSGFVSQCGPQQCYGSVRNSLSDSYGCVVVSMECLKGCGNSRHSKWTPGEVRGQAKTTLKRTCHSLLNLTLLILDRRVFLSILLYSVLAFFTIICNEVVPLLLVTDHDSGGYNMDDSEIGVVLMCVALIQLSWQAFVFPRIAKCLGYRYTFLFGVLLFGFMSLTFPFANRITGPIDDNFMSDVDIGSGFGLNSSQLFINVSTDLDFCGNDISSDGSENLVNENSVTRVPAKVWITLVLIVGVWLTSQVMAFNSIMVLISNSSLTETRGTVNGYGQALCAVGRSLGPVVGATTFAWSENIGKGWPLNHHFVFDLTVVGAVIVIAISLLLPKNIETKRKREAKDTKSCQQTLVEEPNDTIIDSNQEQRTHQA